MEVPIIQSGPYLVTGIVQNTNPHIVTNELGESTDGREGIVVTRRSGVEVNRGQRAANSNPALGEEDLTVPHGALNFA